MLLTQRDY